MILLKNLPKVELHLHLDGSVRESTASEILGVDVSNKMQVNNCKSLSDYLSKFEIPLIVMQSKENLERISYELAVDLKKDNVIYAEIRFCPILHTKNGLSLEEVIDSVLKGLKKVEIKTNLILCMMRNFEEDENKKGIPIGNYTSQYFANIYMNELDHYIKEKLKVKYYIRFMDDGILIVENKEKAKEILKKIKEFIKQKLNLELNKKTGYFPVKNGCVFCGYRIYNNYKLIKRANIIRVKKRIKGWNKKWKKGIYDFEKWNQSFNAWKGYSMHADSYKLIENLKDSMEFLYSEN